MVDQRWLMKADDGMTSFRSRIADKAAAHLSAVTQVVGLETVKPWGDAEPSNKEVGENLNTDWFGH